MPLLHPCGCVAILVIVVVHRCHSCIGLLITCSFEVYMAPSGTIKACLQGGCSQGPLGFVSVVHEVFSNWNLPCTSGEQPKAVTIAYACESLGQLYQQLKRGPHMLAVKIFVKCLWVLRGALWAQMGIFYLNYMGILIQWITCIIDIFRNRCMCEYICNIN